MVVCLRILRRVIDSLAVGLRSRDFRPPRPHRFELETAATVVAVQDDGTGDGRLLVTAQFDLLDRVTRSRILRFAIEEERRQEVRRQAETA